MTPSILVLVLAGGKSERLHALGRMRTAAALPFGGKYRVVDFTLSNCVHSGLHRIGILTQYAPLSLQGHIGIGRAWDLDRRDGGVRLLPPYVRQRDTNWYRGTADALVQNRNVIADAQARHILVVSGDLVYKMDYGPLIARHEARGAALTMVTSREGDPDRHEAVESDATGRVVSLGTRAAGGAPLSVPIQLFRARDLQARLSDPALGPDLFQDVMAPMVAEGLPVYTHPLEGYLRDVGTLDAYYRANLDLLRPLPPMNLHDPDWLIYTPSEDRSPSLVGREADVTSSLVAHGSRIEGTVRRSILFPGVHVGPGAVVEESIVMHDTRVQAGARLCRAIVDKQVRIGADAQVGVGEPVRNREYPHDLSGGVCVIGKRVEIPSGTRVGRNTMVEYGVREADFARPEVPSGSVVRPRGGRPA